MIEDGTRYQRSGGGNRFPAVDLALVDTRVAGAVEAGLLEPGLGRRVCFVARLLSGQRLSGETLAGALGVSRAAVHKYVVSLRSAGLGLESAPGSGYQLGEWGDLLLPEIVLPVLLGSPPRPRPGLDLGLPYLYTSAIGSTNAWLKEEAEQGIPGGAVAVTDHQVDGRGRLGRAWISEAAKDITFSVLLRPGIPPAEAPRLVFASALAVSETVAALGLETRAGIKWPNDVLVDGRKVCGILSEVSMDMDRLHWVVIGLGLNVNSRPDQALRAQDLPAGRPLPTSLAQCLASPLLRGPLFVELVRRLGRRWLQVERGQWDEVLAACRELDVLRGKPVRVSSGQGGRPPLVGTGGGFGPDGELVVIEKNGATTMVVAGDVTLAY